MATDVRISESSTRATASDVRASSDASVTSRNFEPALTPPRRLRMGAVWVVLTRSLGVGVTMLVNVVLARWLSPEDFGSFLLLSSVLALASLLAMLGLNTALVRYVAESLGHQDLARARRSFRLVAAVAAVSVTSVACLTALALSLTDTRLLGLPVTAGLIPMAVTSLVLLAVLQLIAEACRSLHEIRLASLLSGGQTGGLLSNLVFLLLIAAAVVVVKPTFSTAVALNMTAMLLSLPVAVAGLIWATRQRLGSDAQNAAKHDAAHEASSPLPLRSLLGFSTSMLAIQLLTFATTQADLWIAGIWCPHDQLALYGAARRLVLLVALPLQMMNLAVMASIAELCGQRRLQDLERLLRSSALLAAVPAVPIIAVLLLWGGPILELTFGPFFRQAAVPLGILAIGQLFLVGIGSSGGALEMSGNHHASLIVNSITTFALLTVGTWAAWRFGITGLATASAGVIAAQSLALWLLAKRIVGVWTHPQLRPLAAANS
jgi:O-antigen/teichoic acid export membrane protein